MIQTKIQPCHFVLNKIIKDLNVDDYDKEKLRECQKMLDMTCDDLRSIGKSLKYDERIDLNNEDAKRLILLMNNE